MRHGRPADGPEPLKKGPRHLPEAPREEENEVAAKPWEEMGAALLDACGAMVVVLDADGRIVHLNRAGETLTGYRAAEVRGRDYWEVFFPPASAAEMKWTVTQMMAERFAGNYENYLLTHSGRRRWFAWAISVLPGDDGAAAYLVGTGVDITERREAEERLRNIGEAQETDGDENTCCSLVKGLTHTFDSEIVLGGRLIGNPPERVRTLAVYRRGRRLENFDFPLADTFGEDFIRQTDSVYRPCAPWSVPIAPGDDLEITGYAACPILDGRGKPLGLIAVLASGPLPKPGVARSLLQVYASQAATEMERHQAQERLRLLSLAIEHSPASVVITDAEARIQYVNKRFVDLTGYRQEEVYGKTPRILKSGQTPPDTYRELWRQLRSGNEWRGHFLNRKKNGDLFWEEASISPLLDGQGAVTHFVAVKEDITERKRLEAQIWHQANYDSLTDLPNRLLFLDRLQQTLRQADRDQTRAALLFVDLDRFKTVNDTLGHEAGDDLLREMVHRIRGCVRTDDTVARMGGDEFTVILPRLQHPDGAGKVAGKILASLGEPFLLRGKEILLTASIGIAIYPEHGHDYVSLLRHADVAMYQVKEGGRNAFRFHLAPAAAD